MNNATKDGANLIQSLSTLGILEIDAKQLKSAAPNSTRNYQLPDRKVKADELNASDSKLRQTPVLLRPHTQPSLFWKALASTIAPLITNATNLTDEDMALFLSTPTQAGIPGGEFVPREITNFQIFSKADAVQKLDHPGFSLEGASYFSMLASFFRNLTSDSDSSSINIAREALLRATEAKNKAWKNAFSAYEDKIRNGVDSPPFTEFLNTNVEYSQAWELERQMQAAYTDLQGSDMEVISRQIDILKASDNRLSSSKLC
ncbi:Uncharacterized protein LW93_2935 [Fusarium fujikuroi]|nr:Uncharacterized protein LW93_2935 [Fusarium fujikuroi]